MGNIFELPRYRLIGPLSMPVLRDAIVPFEGINAPEWLDQPLLQNQSEVWQRLRNNGLTPARSMYGLTVRSVSRNLIPKRKKSMKNDEAMEIGVFCHSTSSQLWNKEVRSQVVSSMENPVPVILVHHPIPNEGWDLITPRKHGLQLWLRMIMCGARVGALREIRTLNWNMLNSEDICFYPDSQLGQLEEKERSMKEKEKFDTLPPAKRIGVPWFTLPWQQLLNDWSTTGAGQFFVIRDDKQLEGVEELLENRRGGKFVADEGLVAVLVCMESGGNLERGSVVCLPTGPDDLSKPKEEDPKLQCVQRRLQPEQGLVVSPIYSSQVAGFVVEGGFSYNRGCSAGVAFIASAALKKLFTTLDWNENLKMLVISKGCPFYKKASVKVLKKLKLLL